MRCSRARKLIDSECYWPLSEAESRKLEEHVAKCLPCAAYRKAARASVAALREDALRVADSSRSDLALFERVCARVCLGAFGPFAKRSAASVFVMWVDSRLNAVPGTVRKVTAAIAATLAIAIVLTLSFGSASGETVHAVAVDRMFSIYVWEAPSGRVYASLTSRTAVLQHRRWEGPP